MTLALTQPERIDQLVIIDIAPSSEVMLENTTMDLQKLASLQLYKFKCKNELEAYLREEQLVSKKIRFFLTERGKCRVLYEEISDSNCVYFESFILVRITLRYVELCYDFPISFFCFQSSKIFLKISHASKIFQDKLDPRRFFKNGRQTLGSCYDF